MSDAVRSGFVVKATNAAGHVMWVSRPRGTVRVFGPLKKADVFRTRIEAHAAIVHFTAAFEGRARFAFSVEATE
jgi:hypothetical protein